MVTIYLISIPPIPVLDFMVLYMVVSIEESLFKDYPSKFISLELFKILNLLKATRNSDLNIN